MHKFGAMLTKYMKDATISPNTLAEKTGMDAARVQKLMAGEAPTQEEMEKCAGHLKFSDADMKECTVDNHDTDETETPNEDKPDAIADKEGDDDTETPDDDPENYEDNEDDPENETPQRGDDEEDDEMDSKVAAAKKAAKGGTKPPWAKAGKQALELVTAMTGTNNPNKQASILASWKEQSVKIETMAKEFAELKKQREDEKRTALIARGRAEGKLSNPLIRLYAKRSVEDFEEFLNAAPVIFNREELSVPEASSAPVLLSRAEIDVCEISGRSTKELAEFVKASRQNEVMFGDTLVDSQILATYK